MNEIDRRMFLTRAAGGMAAMALIPNLQAFGGLSAEDSLRVGVIGVGRQGDYG